MARKKKKRTGMTLIEVLLAIVILSIGVSALMLALGRCLSLVRTARNREVARALARRVQTENPIDRKEIEESSESGSFDDAPEYEWIRTVEPVDEELHPGLFWVITKVQWSQQGRNVTEEIAAYVYAPEAESLTGKP